MPLVTDDGAEIAVELVITVWMGGQVIHLVDDVWPELEATKYSRGRLPMVQRREAKHYSTPQAAASGIRGQRYITVIQSTMRSTEEGGKYYASVYSPHSDYDLFQHSELLDRSNQ
jgi:hypothetical protein